MFSATDPITFAWERIKTDPGTILGAIIVGIVLWFGIEFIISFAVNMVGIAVGAATSAATGVGRHRVSDATAVPFFVGFGILGAVLHLVSAVVNIVVSSYFTAGITNFVLKVAKGSAYTFGDVFGGARFMITVMVAQFISGLAFVLGIVLLIVPGIFVLICLSMTLPLIIDRGLGPIEALSESWKLTEGNRLNIFIFGLIAFVMFFFGGFCSCGIGLLLLFPLLWIAHSFIYLRLTGQPVAQVGRAV